MSSEPGGNVSLAVVLKALRDQQGLSQTEVEAATGVSSMVVHRLENNKVARITFEDLAPLAKFYGLDLNQVGAILGMWEVPEQEATTLTLESIRLIRVIKDALLEHADDASLIAAFLLQNLKAFLSLQRGKKSGNSGSGVAIPGLPSWIKLRTGT